MVEALIEAAKMLTKDTRASPIIRAAAVEAVRRGLRMAFWRARVPGSRKARANGQPMTRARGRAISGLRMATPKKTTTAPEATLTSRLPSERNRPASSRATPTAVTSTPRTIRRLRKPVGAKAVSGWRAATGGTRVAFSAGSSAASTVTTRPTTSDTITVRGRNWMPVAGMSAPRNVLSRARRPLAISTPRPRPTSEATRATMNDSTSTEVITWRRLAPRQRSRASSRVRWATMMVKVLKIRNAPTSRATKAKASSAVPRNRPMVSLMAAAWSAASSSPVRTSYFGSTAARMRSRSCSGVTPSWAAASISSKRPSRFITSWAVARSKPTRRAPPRLSASPKPMMPLMVKVRAGPWNSTLTWSPTL